MPILATYFSIRAASVSVTVADGGAPAETTTSLTFDSSDVVSFGATTLSVVTSRAATDPAPDAEAP